jgi:hypothetical protein
MRPPRDVPRVEEMAVVPERVFAAREAGANSVAIARTVRANFERIGGPRVACKSLMLQVKSLKS